MQEFMMKLFGVAVLGTLLGVTALPVVAQEAEEPAAIMAEEAEPEQAASITGQVASVDVEDSSLVVSYTVDETQATIESASFKVTDDTIIMQAETALDLSAIAEGATVTIEYSLYAENARWAKAIWVAPAEIPAAESDSVI